MTIEVRQLVIRSQVGGQAPDAQTSQAATAHELEQMRALILAECKAWLREQLQQAKER